MVKTNLKAAGTIYHLQGKDIMGFSGMLSSHNIGIAPALALAEALAIDISKVDFYGIEGISSNPEGTLSPLVKEALTKVSAEIINYLSRL